MAFDDLPAPLLAEVEKEVGPITKSETVSTGLNSEIAARIDSSASSFFVKGMRCDHKRVWTQRREAEVNPFLRGISPTLLWQIEESGWLLLGFEHLSGHHADYSPDSPDLPVVVNLLGRLGGVALPEIELRNVEQRLSAYVQRPADVDYFAGSSLVHTDLNNHNVLVNDSTAYLVDWAWASRGAAWLDAAYWVVWLLAAGKHTPLSAEGWAAKVPAWRAASPEAVTAFALATANLWEEIAGPDPDPWTATILDASRLWARHRQVT
ncbi:RIO1 family regulatory kinase/ATPase [Streptomyces sp. NPDC047097]|uniref:RIO1 family regulatory kinase/ATPase domain-containing protein n=1 Tax=Streptomyces sp. NPDC047097 TaxID=3155260 RepID=UPI0033CD5B07